ncbi:hypothetical protein [Sphingobium sp. Sx8-8]|uniref:hypothetical protein n=1 Tax=Sphingobium sp. Sx8-8 TaxID=2933617 RepID=UPI001F57E6F6|nr:hypothetical protein [Sphingobium sp. Sx8-8]
MNIPLLGKNVPSCVRQARRSLLSFVFDTGELIKDYGCTGIMGNGFCRICEDNHISVLSETRLFSFIVLNVSISFLFSDTKNRRAMVMTRRLSDRLRRG